jgi:hypothetical protein
MKEKVLTVLVIISLALSVFSLVLTLRATPNTITTVSTDMETLRADSFELKIKDLFEYYKQLGQYFESVQFTRIANESIMNEYNRDYIGNSNLTLVSTDFFYNNVLQGNHRFFIMIRYHDVFYCRTESNVFYCTP